MGYKVKWDWDDEGFKEILSKCGPVTEEAAQRVLSRVGTEHYELGETYYAETTQRPRVSVRTKDDRHSRNHEAKYQLLVQAIAGGGE